MDLITIAVLTNIGITAYAFHKIKQIHLATYRIEESAKHADQETNRLYGQIQAYHDLIATIQPRKPLPPLRGWAASPDFLLHAANHVLTKKPRTIVECSSGASTIVLARCCEINGFGHVFSLEHDPEYAKKTRNNIEEQKLNGWATIIDAPLKPYPQFNDQQWYSIDGSDLLRSPIDLVVVDGPPSDTAPLARYPVLPLFYASLGNDCTILVDDAARTAETEMLEKWKSEFPDLSYSSLFAEKGCVKIEVNSQHIKTSTS